MYIPYNDLKAVRFLPGTKVSHDYEGNNVNTFSYRELIDIKVPAIGIPCRQNRLIVIDVDVVSDQHKHDGREFWGNFCAQNHIPQTYTVQTASGGFHFYFALPNGLNEDTFRAPSALAPGVDIKYNGWVGAPPTKGYRVLWGDISKIAEAPPTLMAALTTAKQQPATFDDPSIGIQLNAHRPFTETQVAELRTKIEWLQQNGTLSRSEWRDGLFALKAGINDPELLDELAEMWTMNGSYEQGDEVEARSIVERADKYGSIGPGSIFAIINAVQLREGASSVDSDNSLEQILSKSKVIYSFNKQGGLKIEPSESNAAALIGAMYDENTLYHDIKADLYIFRGKQYSDIELTNMMVPRLQSSSEGLGLQKFRKTAIKAGLEILLHKRRRDPHLDYLNNLHWDGRERIEQFFQKYCGVEDNHYHRKVSKNFWVSLAARGLKPGCKFDSMVILEGKEGVRKSSLVEAIGGMYTFAPSRRDAMENLDELRKMHQSVIVELPELMGLVNQSPERVKAFLASHFDHVRDLYARQATRRDRGFVFIGTTNSSEYLHMDMGMRRFWPIKIPDNHAAIDIDGILSERDQLFAEAISYFKDGYPFYTIESDILAEHTSQKIISDPLNEVIEDLLKEVQATSTGQVYKVLSDNGYVNRGLTINVKTRIENSLRRIGFAKTTGDNFARVNPVKEYSAVQSYDFGNII